MEVDGLDSVDIPSELKIGQFAQSRMQEILGFQGYINEPRQGNATAQQLPRHLRRRAVSHNPKRLPKRLQEKHIRERDKSGCNQGKTKRPSRKYRRSPRNLLSEYNRRQKEFGWLETHIWHAKRFHMTKKFGYKIADFPNDKGFRACYRASAKQSLMQDISYYPLIELVGREEEILEGLKPFTPVQVSSGFGHREFIEGSREGKTLIYEPEKFPFGVMGEVAFLWEYQMAEEEKSQRRSLWIWIHPAFYENFRDLLFKQFETEKQIFDGQIESNLTNNVDKEKMATRNIPFVKVPKFKSKNSDVQISLLKDTMNRFRLVGPLSSIVLGHTLQVSDIEMDSESGWWSQFYSAPNEKEMFRQQKEWWEKIAKVEPKSLSSGVVLALTVRDPRVTLPRKRGAIQTTDVGDVLQNVDIKKAGKSPIWKSEVRDSVAGSKVADHVINQKRSKLLIPGSNLELDSDEARIPVLLIQQPGCPRSGFASGWDIIVPGGWGMPFWVNLVFQGARVGGLREMRHLAFESGCPELLRRMPDSQVGQLALKEEAQELEEKYFMCPPDKRCNFNKIGTVSPFSTPWQILLKDFSSSNEEIDRFYLVREKRVLMRIQSNLSAGTDTEIEPDIEVGLVPVQLEVVGKGTVCCNSIICIPSEEDFANLTKEGANFFKNHCPTEPVGGDEKAPERKELKKKHTKMKTSLRTKWKKEKEILVQTKAETILKKQKLEPEKEHDLNFKIDQLKKERQDEISKYDEEIKSLWVPKCTSLKNSCSRTVIGLLVEGGYSLRRGKTVGLGLVSTNALAHYIKCVSSLDKKLTNLVLVREPTSAQYHYAKINVNMN